jgi:hypothetical protein
MHVTGIATGWYFYWTAVYAKWRPTSTQATRCAGNQVIAAGHWFDIISSKPTMGMEAPPASQPPFGAWQL